MSAARLSKDEIARRVRDLGPWFHNMELGGVATAPEHFLGDYPRNKFARFSAALPEDLSGKSVLDVGCNGGFYSMEMKRRGAARVVAIDSDPEYLDQARFAAQVSDLEIEFRQMSVFDVPRLGERFDLVLFLGVLYHLRYPLLALDLLHEHAVGDLLVFQSMQRGSGEVEEPEEDYEFGEKEMFESAGWPKMFFVQPALSNISFSPNS